MIDKLDKWIAQQKHNEWVDCIFPEIPMPCSFDFQQALHNIEPINLPPFPVPAVFITQNEIDIMVKEAVENEREACAKVCEENGVITGYLEANFFATLIRERSE